MNKKKSNRYLCMICQNAHVKTASSICKKCCKDDVEIGRVEIGNCRKSKNTWRDQNAD